MPDSKARAEVELRQSICTSNPTGSDIYQWGDPKAEHVTNTGIEREGGVTNIYKQTTTFTTAGQSTMIAKDGTIVQIDSLSNVRLNNTVIGNVGTLAIFARGIVPYCQDAAWTADSTILMVNRSSGSVSVQEYNPYTATIVNSRTIVFASFPTGPVIDFRLVRYTDMHYVDNQEFVVHQGKSTNWFLAESGTTVTAIATSSFNATDCFRFATNAYITGRYGGQYWGVGTITATLSQISGSAVCAVFIDRFPGTAFARAQITINAPIVDATYTCAYTFGIIGQTSAGTLNSIATFFGVATSGVVAVTATNSTTSYTFGYAESNFFLTAGATQYYTMMNPIPTHNASLYYAVATNANSATWQVGGYGKLTDTFGNANNLASLRICMVAGVPSYYSAAYVGGTGTWSSAVPQSSDCLGVPLTNVGEIDETYWPQIDDDGSTKSRLLYRFNSRYYFVDIRSGQVPSLQRVSDNLFIAYNAITPLNVIDVRNKRMAMGPNDYNGRLWMIAGGTTTQTINKIVARIEGFNVNSVDTGDKFCTYPSPGLVTQNFVTFGIEMPSPTVYFPSDMFVRVYWNDSYQATFFSDNPVTAIASDPLSSGLTYVPDTRIPIAMGYLYYDTRVIQTDVETIFTGVGVTGNADIDFDYLCYETGNDIPGFYRAFVLFGQTFIFDGKSIWLTSFSGSLYSGKGNAPMCNAAGMTLIAVAPTEVYFLSSFDNSIYVYTGGRSLQKFKRMNELETIQNGVYSVRDNTLAMQTSGHWVWVRDGVVTYNAKDAAQTSVSLYDTSNGITIANNTAQWIYGWNASGTVQQLDLQTAYFGLRNNMRSIVTGWDVYFHSSTNVSTTFNYVVYTMDSSRESFNTQKGQQAITPTMYDANGNGHVRIQPQRPRCIATSLEIICNSKIVITKIVPEYKPDNAGVPAADRSQ